MFIHISFLGLWLRRTYYRFFFFFSLPLLLCTHTYACHKKKSQEDIHKSCYARTRKTTNTFPPSIPKMYSIMMTWRQNCPIQEKKTSLFWETFTKLWIINLEIHVNFEGYSKQTKMPTEYMFKISSKLFLIGQPKKFAATKIKRKKNTCS